MVYLIAFSLWSYTVYKTKIEPKCAKVSIHHASGDDSESDGEEDVDSARSEVCFEIELAVFMLNEGIIKLTL